MASSRKSEDAEDVDNAILWATTFLSCQGARVTFECPAVRRGARSPRAEREAQRLERTRLLFISGAASTAAAVAVWRAREGVQAIIVQDFEDDGLSTKVDQNTYQPSQTSNLQSPLIQQLSNDTTGFLLKYGVPGVTPLMHGTHLQNLFQQLYRNETPLPEDRSALSHYIYCFRINRIWQCLHAKPRGSESPFIALFLSWQSVGELAESDFRGSSPNRGSLPRDLEKEDESKLSTFVNNLPNVKNNAKPLQFELTEPQAWQLLAKFKSCLGRIKSTASLIKTLVQGHEDPEKHTVKVADRLLLTGAVKLLAANLQILGWLAHHSSSFWKLLESLGPVFDKRMGELHRTAEAVKHSNSSEESLDREERGLRIGTESIRSWLKQLADYYQLLYDLSEGPEANGVIGGRVEIKVHVLPKIPPQDELVSADRILQGLNGPSKQRGVWSELANLVRQSCEATAQGQLSLPGGALHPEAYLVKPGIIGSAGGCCFCCSRLLKLSHTKSTNRSTELPIQSWMPPDATPKEIKLQILDDLARLLQEYLGTKLPPDEEAVFRLRLVKRDEGSSKEHGSSPR
ncbi:hypothetical protein FRC01_013936 [Tulasnella sp. 417]|nr:hypothetical protein FRC01_013936 [Tulasnella sp. 417]